MVRKNRRWFIIYLLILINFPFYMTSLADRFIYPPEVLAAYSAVNACERIYPTLGSAGTSIQDGTVCFYDNITPETAATFAALPIEEGSRLVLRSGGGDVESGLDMANLILEKKLPVIVWHQCLSSCANYLFLAGFTKIVMPQSIVAWHGGPPRVPREDLNAAALARYKGIMAKEQSFFRRIGVDENLLYEPAPGSGVTSENRENRFWTWHADELRERFGVQNIIWMWYPEFRPSSSAG